MLPITKLGIFILINLTQLVEIMHNIFKVQGSNPDHHKKIGIFFHKLLEAKSYMYI